MLFFIGIGFIRWKVKRLQRTEEPLTAEQPGD
jgi:hypothetical protein